MSTVLPKRLGALAALSDDDMHALLACAERISFRAGQEILREGQHNASLYVVQEGLLHVCRRAKKHEVLLGRIEPGAVFGEVSLFDPGPTTATVRAVSDGLLIHLGRRQLDAFVTQRPVAAAQFLSALLSEMAQRLRRVDERLTDSIVWGGLLK